MATLYLAVVRCDVNRKNYNRNVTELHSGNASVTYDELGIIAHARVKLSTVNCLPVKLQIS